MTEQTPVTGAVQPPEAPPRVLALREAATLITGQRQQDYGSPEVNFQRIATIWNVLKPGANFVPADVALLMAGLKLARAAEGYKRDTYVDAVGYLGIGVELSESNGTSDLTDELREAVNAELNRRNDEGYKE